MMKRLSLAAAVVTSLSVFAQGAPPPPPGKAAPPPPGKAAPAPAPAAAPAPAPAPAPAAAAPAPAPAAAAMDMSKMGAASRKPSNEAKTKKEIEAFFKEEDALMAAKNWEALLSRVDFPVYMVTDNSAGMAMGEPNTRDAYLASMKPFWENMPPNTTTKHKLTISVLSDAIANVVDDFEMTMGKQKMKGRNATTVVKVGGSWKFKTMTEAGWGDVGAPYAAPPPPAATGAAAPPPPGKAAPAPAPAPGATGTAAPPPPKK